MSDEHPFKLIPEEDCVRKLPFYFGGGIEVVELNLSVCAVCLVFIPLCF